MSSKGQIVEIPASASLYESAKRSFHSRKDELTWKSASRTYSLFDGFLVGEHPGVEHFKIGQRKGINVGGKKEPLYVIAIDPAENRLFVGAGEKHPGLFTEAVRLDDHDLALLSINQPTEILEGGLAVKVIMEGSEGEIPARLYHWEGPYFLEFDRKVPINIKDHIKTITTY